MKFLHEQLRLYAICCDETLKEIEEVLSSGVTMLQLRMKNADTEQRIKRAKEILPLCRKYHVPFIINDDLEAALRCGADGVHLGQDDTSVLAARKQTGADFIIGATAKSPEQAILAEKQGADYIGTGAAFASSTKGDAKRLTKDEMREVISSVKIPAVLIGGITAENIPELIGIPAAGIACASAVFAAENISAQTKKLSMLCHSLFGQKIKKVLSIAGSDSSGGAGIQADLKTICAHGLYGMTAITALTAQNTLGVSAIMEADTDFVGKQLDSIFNDIFPDVVKIGMLSSAAIVRITAEKLREYHAQNIVLDPVMVSTSGSALMKNEAIEVAEKLLFPIASVITPNIPEAERLIGERITNRSAMEKAAEKLYQKYGTAVLLKGGHSISDADDILFDGEAHWFFGEKIDNQNTHGTGCTLSSAIACNLAMGYDLKTSVSNAKAYISGALSAMLDLGQGSGPLDHLYQMHF